VGDNVCGNPAKWVHAPRRPHLYWQ
jgi:hypothetical protein